MYPCGTPALVFGFVFLDHRLNAFLRVYRLRHPESLITSALGLRGGCSSLFALSLPANSLCGAAARSLAMAWSIG